MTTIDSGLHQLLSTKQYTAAVAYIKAKPADTALDADKRDCNLSLMYYLMGDYARAKEVVNSALARAEADGRADVWPRLYYRLAKAHEGLQDYDAMCSAYDHMYERLPEEDRDKKLKHMQDYYNKDICYLKHWVLKHGGYFDKLDIEYYDTDYRGMISNKLIKDKDIIIKIPKVCIIDGETCKKNNPYMDELIPKEVAGCLDSHTTMALRILYDENTNGFYMPYIRCFPKLYDNVIYNYNKKEIGMLKGSIVLVSILRLLVQIIKKYMGMHIHAKKVPFSIKEFLWAYTAVSSRTYATTIDNKSTSCMVPISDMANHAHITNTTWGYNQYSNCFEVLAVGDIRKGDIIYETYGPKSNVELLQIYGFTLTDNVFDKSYLICNPVVDALYSKYINIIMTSIDESSKLLDHLILMINRIDSRYTNLLFNTIGIFEIGYLYNKNNINMLNLVRQDDIPTCRRSERDMLNNVLFLIKNSLDAFPMTRQEYADILNRADSTFNVRNIATLCIGEIDVLGFWKLMCEQLIEVLSGPEPVTEVFKTVCGKLAKFPYIVTFKPYIDQLENLPEEAPATAKPAAKGSVPDDPTTKKSSATSSVPDN